MTHANPDTFDQPTMGEDATNVVPYAPKRKGRKDASGQEEVINISLVKKSIKELCHLYMQKQQHSANFNDGVKAVAEKAGINAGPLKKYVVARCKKKLFELDRDQAQLALLFYDLGGADVD